MKARPMKARLHTLFAALGLATLSAIWMIAPLDRSFFHWSGSATGFVLAHVVDFALVWAAMAWLLHRLDRPGRWRTVGWPTLICFSPCIALASWSALPGTNVPALLLPAVALCCLVGWLLALLFSGRSAPRAERIFAAASIFLVFLSIVGVVSLAQAGRLAWSIRQPTTVSATRPVPATPAGPRIIWIVMDELSFQQVYEHRPPDLALPAFDALAAQANDLTHVDPAAQLTELAIPSYLTGLPLDQDSTAHPQLLLHRSDEDRWIAFDQHDTVFEDAHRVGDRTGLAGWYTPYCRLAPAVLDRCFWTYNQPNRNGMIASASTLSNIWAPLRRLALAAVPAALQIGILHLQSDQAIEAQQHIQDYNHILDASDALLRDPSMGFVLLHLPVPHMPGIFDRSTHTLTDRPSGYIDNLALADQCLAHLRLTLEQTGQWDSSTVLVMGDHSWRTFMPANMLHDPGGADDLAARRGYDPRPVYLIKLAGQHTAQTIDVPFHAQHTRLLLDALLHQQIRTPADLDAWLRSQP